MFIIIIITVTVLFSGQLEHIICHSASIGVTLAHAVTPSLVKLMLFNPINCHNFALIRQSATEPQT